MKKITLNRKVKETINKILKRRQFGERANH